MKIHDLLQNWQIFLKNLKREQRINRSTMSKKKVYAYTSSAKQVRRQNATILQLWSNFFANTVIDGMKDSWRLLLITNNRKEYKKLLLVK